MKAVFIFLISFIFYEQILSNEPITVHIIPHTHDDAGWLNTFQEYFDGKGNLNISVNNILDNMVYSLNEKLDRTFIYVEVAYFEKWYSNITEEKKQQVKDLVKEGRLEFINGGYVMHDEAASYYQHMIDQMRLGMLFLKKEFNVEPEIGWYIDPFGHSATNVFSFVEFRLICFQKWDLRISFFPV